VQLSTHELAQAMLRALKSGATAETGQLDITRAFLMTYDWLNVGIP
jgi:hypothetical protein